MLASNSNTQFRIFASLPDRVQATIVAYADEVELSTNAVITFAIAYFLELETIPLENKQSHTNTGSILNDLPTSLQGEIKAYAAEDVMPPEFVIELAIAHFLNPDSVTFDDCLTGLQRDRIELLRRQKRNWQVTAAGVVA